MDGNSKQPEQDLLGAIDRLTKSPGERAEIVWESLRSASPELTDYDILCFAAEYIGKMSLKWLWLGDMAKAILSLVYKAHYQAEVWRNE